MPDSEINLENFHTVSWFRKCISAFVKNVVMNEMIANQPDHVYYLEYDHRRTRAMCEALDNLNFDYDLKDDDEIFITYNEDTFRAVAKQLVIFEQLEIDNFGSFSIGGNSNNIRRIHDFIAHTILGVEMDHRQIRTIDEWNLQYNNKSFAIGVFAHPEKFIQFTYRNSKYAVSKMILGKVVEFLQDSELLLMVRSKANLVTFLTDRGIKSAEAMVDFMSGNQNRSFFDTIDDDEEEVMDEPECDCEECSSAREQRDSNLEQLLGRRTRSSSSSRSSAFISAIMNSGEQGENLLRNDIMDSNYVKNITRQAVNDYEEAKLKIKLIHRFTDTISKFGGAESLQTQFKEECKKELEKKYKPFIEKITA